MLLKFKIFVYNLLFIDLKWWYLLHFDKIVKSQIKNPKSIPIIIINFNQLFYLKKLVDFHLERNFENIIIVDNLSTYPQLIEYYKTLKGVTVEFMGQNYGHKVFFENKMLQKKYGQGFFVVTDADVIPNENLPENFMSILLKALIKEFSTVTKVGFALDIENIPDYYSLKEKVVKWEKQFWTYPYKNNIDAYFAKIDTTFALYKPKYPIDHNNYTNWNFFNGIRFAGKFTAKHGGWYLDSTNMSNEQIYYQKSSTNVSSWLTDKDGNLDPKYSSKYS